MEYESLQRAQVSSAELIDDGVNALTHLTFIL